MSRRRSLRTCLEPRCPTLTDKTGGRCDRHEAERRSAQDAVRGNWRQRGYDREYDANRAIVLREETHCHICGEPVDVALSGRDPNGPSADHVVRREDGGTNARSNLRLSHLRCNTGRTRRTGQDGTAPADTTTPEPRVYRYGSIDLG